MSNHGRPTNIGTRPTGGDTAAVWANIENSRSQYVRKVGVLSDVGWERRGSISPPSA
jgi:hypothetical protein